MSANDLRRRQAKELRYRKALCKEINLDVIREWLSEAQEETNDVAYAIEDDDILLAAMDGDTEEAYEFRVAFSDLSCDIERMNDDINGYDSWIPERFDDFFCAVGNKEEEMGYDAYESDYYGLSPFEGELAQGESRKRLERLTKKDLIAAAQQCFRVAFAYIGLKNRYDELKASLDIIRGENAELIDALRRIMELYNKADALGWAEWMNTHEREFDKLTASLPGECWLR